MTIKYFLNETPLTSPDETPLTSPDESQVPNTILAQQSDDILEQVQGIFNRLINMSTCIGDKDGEDGCFRIIMNTLCFISNEMQNNSDALLALKSLHENSYTLSRCEFEEDPAQGDGEYLRSEFNKLVRELDDLIASDAQIPNTYDRRWFLSLPDHDSHWYQQADDRGDVSSEASTYCGSAMAESLSSGSAVR